MSIFNFNFKKEKKDARPPETGEEIIGGHEKKEYDAAIEALDEKKEDDFFGRHTYTESASTVFSVIKAIVYISFIIVVSCAIAYFAITCANDVFAFVKSDEEVEVEIPEYATCAQLSEILGDAGVIDYPAVFRLYAKVKKIDENEAYAFVAGKYTVNAMMNYEELMTTFLAITKRETVRITIPEGFTVDEVIDLFLSNGIGTREGFISAINDYEYEYDYINSIDMTDRFYRLEGYLYPDTYYFYTDNSETYYIYKLLDRFDEMFGENLRNKADEMGYTIDQVVTLASIIEKEAYFKNDFDQVSSVIHNRLNKPKDYPCLECDSTIIYVLSYQRQERVTELTGADLEIDSPYNSYKTTGLTPGAICNPGYEALTCALYPAATDYYYFVSDIDMTMYYSSTLAEHQAAVAQVKEHKENIAGAGS